MPDLGDVVSGVLHACGEGPHRVGAEAGYALAVAEVAPVAGIGQGADRQLVEVVHQLRFLVRRHVQCVDLLEHVADELACGAVAGG